MFDSMVVKNAAGLLLETGRLVMTFYENECLWAVQSKEDNSPVTAADLASHEKLSEALTRLMPGVPILSEEGKRLELHERKHWTTFWVVDPLDGTREFLKRSGEFTINVALVHEGHPVLGLIACPVQDTVYVGEADSGAFKLSGEASQAPLLPGCSQTPVIAASRRRKAEDLQRFLARLNQPFKVKSMGSALKFCRMAEGGVQVYPRFSPVCEWDVAAGHAIIQSLGGIVVNPQGTVLRYNERERFDEVYFLACSSQKWLDRTFKYWKRFFVEGAGFAN